MGRRGPGIGIGVGQVLGLVREAQTYEQPTAFVDVSGPGARAVADALAEGGDAGAVTVDGDPWRAAVSIRVVDGEPTPAEVDLLRRLTRVAAPALVLARGGGRIPYVLPEDVLDASAEPDAGLLAAAIARAAPDVAPALAARLPVLRSAVERRVVAEAALTNAALALAPWVRGAHLPLLALAQSRMLLKIGTSRGVALPREPQELARAAGPVFAASIGLGLGARALVRRLPVRGPLVHAAVAYAGTRGLGAARRRLP